jgi:hypothetical protein
LLGALARRGRGWRVSVTPAWRRAALVAAAGATLWFAVCGGRALAAGWLARRGDPASLAAAARLAPDDYRVHTRLAISAAHRGDCREALERAAAALRGYPDHAVALGIVARCAPRPASPP